MYISLGEKSAVRMEDIIGIFDIDRITVSLITKQFLANAEQQGIVTVDTGGIPRSFIVSQHNEKRQVRLSICSSTTVGDRQNES